MDLISVNTKMGEDMKKLMFVLTAVTGLSVFADALTPNWFSAAATASPKLQNVAWDSEPTIAEGAWQIDTDIADPAKTLTPTALTDEIQTLMDVEHTLVAEFSNAYDVDARPEIPAGTQAGVIVSKDDNGVLRYFGVVNGAWTQVGTLTAVVDEPVTISIAIAYSARQTGGTPSVTYTIGGQTLVGSTGVAANTTASISFSGCGAVTSTSGNTDVAVAKTVNGSSQTIKSSNLNTVITAAPNNGTVTLFCDTATGGQIEIAGAKTISFTPNTYLKSDIVGADGYTVYQTDSGATSTYACKAAATQATTVGGEEVTVKVDESFIPQGKTVADLTSQELVKYAAGAQSVSDPMPMAHSSPQGTSSSVTFGFSNLKLPPKDSGLTVTYKLYKGTDVVDSSTATAIFTVNNPADGLYRMKACVGSEEVASDTVIGVKNVQATGNDRKTTVVAVPWTEVGQASIAPTNLIKTANLTANDKLKVFDSASGTFDVYNLTASKTWEFVPVVSALANKTAPSVAAISRGQAVILERSNTSNPICLIGEYSVDPASSPAPANSWSLMANPNVEDDLNLDNKFSSDTTDKVIVPTAGAPKMFSKATGGKWGYSSVQKVEGKNRVKQITVTDETIPAGTGFFYQNTGAAKQINW